MQKVRYELDPHNRLVLRSGKKSDLLKFRKVLDGRFKADKNNELSYHIKAPLDDKENTPYHPALRASGTGQVPHQVKLRGKWSLTDTHDLRLILDKWGRETFGDEITLQGEILDVNKNSLLFAVTTTTKENTKSTYILNLGGSWKVDEHNRLSFRVRKEKGSHDILTFNGVWEINKNHQVVYQYEKARLIRKKRKTHTLAFKGYWDIKEKLRISYILSKDDDSAFHFKAGGGIFQGNYIKYEVGIGLTGKARPAKRTITLFGTWRVKKNVGLIFEIEYENKKMHEIVFGAEARLTGKDTVLFKLKNDIENKDIGIDVKLSHKILKGDGEAFIRALKSNRESAIYAGAACRW
ncbi:MAG: hypothetical protein ISS90_00565 [Candidatus Omnitrophica bacterium]|nr:hypothetical protein [Candidatus Omnitrophota bacterium]